jgi:UDP-N-acetylmuramate-alanine ligase
LATADIALLDNIYPARETQDAFPDITSSTIVANASAESLVVHPGSEEEILEFIREHATGLDAIVLLLGAGDIGRLAGQLIKLPSS